MWLAVHDSSDARTVNAAAQHNWRAHWEYVFTRHGSPLLRPDVVFCSGLSAAGQRFPALVGCPEECDLVLFYLPDLPRGRTPDVVDWPDLPGAARDATCSDVVLAIEITTQNPGNSNAVQRFGRVFDHARAGLPLLFACPESAIRSVTGGPIAGHRGSTDAAVVAAATDLVRRNVAVNAASISGHPSLVATSSGALSGPFHPSQAHSAWTALGIRTAGDTYGVGTGLLLLPCTWGEIPADYRWSGVQLSPLWDVIGESMVLAQTRGVAAARAGGPVFAAAVAVSDASASNGMGHGGSGEPHPALRADGVSFGFPRGSVRRSGAGYRSRDPNRHYISPIKASTLSTSALGSTPSAALTRWFQARRVDQALVARVAATLAGRRLLLDIDVPPGYASKDTYVGRFTEFFDHCFVRDAPASGSASSPRAVDASPGRRRHALCFTIGLPRTSFDAVCRDVYGSRWLSVGDFVRLTDQVVVGEPLANLVGVRPGTVIAWR